MAATRITNTNSNSTATMTASSAGRKRRIAATIGSVVTVDLLLEPEAGFVPEPLFDTVGRIQFVLGWGNYLPGLHLLVEDMHEQETAAVTSLDAGWGDRRADLLVTVPKERLSASINVDALKIGSVLNLQGNLKVAVAEINDDGVVLDANPPLAGSCYTCKHLTVLKVQQVPAYKFEYHLAPPLQSQSPQDSDLPVDESRYDVCTFALGCFWGAELAFQRETGVVGSVVGYSQGRTINPTYDQVCTGSTHHREAVQVVFDTQQTCFATLLQTALERLAATVGGTSSTAAAATMRVFDTPEEQSSKQYRHGVYYHTDEQRDIALEAVAANNNLYKIEVKPAKTFYRAEEWHQQYLLKGGQSARKGAKETIRCFG